MINKRHIVSGLKSAHGLWRAGENGLLARHSGLLRTSGRQHPFKGGSGDIAEGGSGEVGRCVERHEEGGPGSHRWGTARAA
jgi:hypothetical protein